MAGQPSQPGDGEPQEQGPARQREQTEEGPEEGGKPQEGEGKKPEPSEPKDGKEPQGGQESKDDGENRVGRKPESETEDPTAPGTDADRWGDLPPRAQEIFRNQGRDDVPVQYRDWIDSYYRRLNSPTAGSSTGR